MSNIKEPHKIQQNLLTGLLVEMLKSILIGRDSNILLG